MVKLDQFRMETREWLDANCPLSMRTPAKEEEMYGGPRTTDKDALLWLDRMAAKGWTAPQWPTEYGGAGLSKTEYLILQEEMLAIKARLPAQGMGFSMIGPTLLDYGTEQQKLTHLPKIASGEIRWCQGYSEPGAGSDLASLQTRCEDKGDYFQINGQKTWTSGAQHADWIFTLVRTDPKVPKHDGISFVLIDMDQAGVTTRPIGLLSGNSPFCETFFDNARAEKYNLVGQLNRGWTVGKRLLQHERSSIAGLNSGGMRGRYENMRDLATLAKEYIGLIQGKISDPTLRQSIIENNMDQQAFNITQRRAMAENESGDTQGHATSMFKYYGAGVNQQQLELQLKVMGTQSLGWEGPEFSEEEADLTRSWLRSKASSIAGGSSEVQLNIVAKRVLGLPD
ncbi:MAG: acyl-CoA dehydrogenase family protein [Pseudomonadales bacterium]|nr:acyl-CoA dehydrogenase family protein [Pseudomonadales bacterium]